MNSNSMNILNLLICVLNKLLKRNLENLLLMLLLKLILVYACTCKKDVFILLRIWIHVLVNVMKCRYLLWNPHKDTHMLLFVLRNNVLYTFKVLITLKMKEIKKKKQILKHATGEKALFKWKMIAGFSSTRTVLPCPVGSDVKKHPD